MNYWYTLNASLIGRRDHKIMNIIIVYTLTHSLCNRKNINFFCHLSLSLSLPLSVTY